MVNVNLMSRWRKVLEAAVWYHVCRQPEELGCGGRGDTPRNSSLSIVPTSNHLRPAEAQLWSSGKARQL